MISLKVVSSDSAGLASAGLLPSSAQLWGLRFHQHGLCLCVGLRQVHFIKPSPPLCHWCSLVVEDLTYAGGNVMTRNGEVR